MGIENNEAILATTWSREKAEEMLTWCFNHVPYRLIAHTHSLVNVKTTIILGPDGSKKGWDDAELGKKYRDAFIKKLESFNYEDGSNPFDWVEVGYGEFGQTILRGNCFNRYTDTPYYEE